MNQEILFLIILSIFVNIGINNVSSQYNTQRFPEGFLFGVATSAYQIEGAWNVNGKGVNIWDTLTHETTLVADGSTGDIACDSYTHGVEDVKLIKNLGVDFYRFSFSWSRLLPTGFVNEINPDGVRYYNEIINELLAQGIQPMVTLYHWDLPQPLQILGGWTSDTIVDYFADYARFSYETFGDRVKIWTTFNEPLIVCQQGYGDVSKAPALNLAGVGDYLCGHNLLKAHAKAYHIYDDEYRATQRGNVTITFDSGWYEPDTLTVADIEASERAQQFSLGWFAHPIFSTTGDYPAVMKEFIAHRSRNEGFEESRLPEFTAEEVEYLRGTADWFGLNHYTTNMVSDREDVEFGTPHYYKDRRVTTYQNETWPVTASDWFKVVPWGFRSILNWVKDQYNNVPIYITESGYSDYGELDDQGRIDYYKSYLSALLDAVHEDGVNVKAYTFWSLLDNFEWLEGYIAKFGIYSVDFNNNSRPRTAKASVEVLKAIVRDRRISNDGSRSQISNSALLTIGFSITYIFLYNKMIIN